MTGNQLKLLRFIARYREQHLNSPTIREMVEGIGVFDNKSLLGILGALERDGYVLRKHGGRSRDVQLTLKAHEILGLRPVSLADPGILGGLQRFTSVFNTSDVSLSQLKTPGTGTSGHELKVNGTTTDLSPDILYAATLLLNSSMNGTSPVLQQQLSKQLLTLIHRSQPGWIIVASLAILATVIKLVGIGPIAMLWYALAFTATLVAVRIIKD